jgi:hypothetical protein
MIYVMISWNLCFMPCLIDQLMTTKIVKGSHRDLQGYMGLEYGKTLHLY